MSLEECARAGASWIGIVSSRKIWVSRSTSHPPHFLCPMVWARSPTKDVAARGISAFKRWMILLSIHSLLHTGLQVLTRAAVAIGSTGIATCLIGSRTSRRAQPRRARVAWRRPLCQLCSQYGHAWLSCIDEVMASIALPSLAWIFERRKGFATSP